MATAMNGSLVWTLRSSSLLRRRFRESQEKVRSTTHLFGVHSESAYARGKYAAPLQPPR
jgi:hypothetical protein